MGAAAGPERERAPMAGRLVGREGGLALNAQIRGERSATMPNRLDPSQMTGRGEDAAGWALDTRVERLDPPCPIDWIAREEGSVLHREEEGSDACRDCSVGREAEVGGASIEGSPPLVLGQLLENIQFGCVTHFFRMTQRNKCLLYIGAGYWRQS